jgi:cytochrome c556
MKPLALILVLSALVGMGPLMPPAHAAEADTAAPKDVRQFMEKELNPAFTDVSYQLFHVRKPGEKPNAELLAAFERLLEKSSQLASGAQGQREAGDSFRRYAAQLHVAVRGLAEASQSGDEAQIDTWMTHVSSVCQSCHAE